MCEDREDALSCNQPSVCAVHQTSLEFGLTLRCHFLQKTDPSSPPQRGPSIQSELYNIYNMEIALLFVFGNIFQQGLLVKEQTGYLTKCEDNLRSIISNFTVGQASEWE